MLKSLNLWALIILCCLSVLYGCQEKGRQEQQHSPLLNELLDKIDSAAFYLEKHELSIRAIKDSLSFFAETSIERYNTFTKLGAMYSSYIADSSLKYYSKARHEAMRMGDISLMQSSDMDRANILTKTGYFKEASILLEGIDLSNLPQNLHYKYYERQMKLYHGLYLGLNTNDSEFRPGFVAKFVLYRDSLLLSAPADYSEVLRETERKYARSNDFDKALEVNQKRLSSLPPGVSANRALVLYDRYAIYHSYMKRPLDDHIEFLLESAINDVCCANHNIASLRYVEAYLTSIGDTKSAKIVSDYYYSTMTKLGSRVRLLDGLSISMQINDKYLGELMHQKRIVQWTLCVILFLVFVLVFILYLTVKSRRKIELLNVSLNRSEKISKGYVLGFFELYSSYIARFIAFRTRVNLNVRKGNTDMVKSLTDPSKEFYNEELKQMYANFDKAFLDIFPDYIDKFNALLLPEYRIKPKSNEILNMELRIFAIIKLGITDSSNISEMLHCSIKTVYNKRSEINQKIAVSREEFGRKLLDI